MKLSEFEIIDKIRKLTEKNISNDVLVPNGDDCFVFKESGNILLTTDSLVENVHFIKKLFPPYSLGVKASAVNLSDIAAMGGTPKFALISLILTKDINEKWIENFYKGLTDTFSKYNVYIGGGNISKGNTLSITITLVGTSETTVLRRSGAKPGDIIFVSGTLGDSALGLELIKMKKNFNKKITNKLNEISEKIQNKLGFSITKKTIFKSVKYLIERHTTPSPRIKLGKILSGIATSCIDISDGLLQDINHILKSSNVGAQIILEKIPLSDEYSLIITIQKYLESGKLDFRINTTDLKYALSGGEDYELLFTVPEDKKEEVLKISKELNLKITEIGKIVEGNELELYLFLKKINRKLSKGWQHF